MHDLLWFDESAPTVRLWSLADDTVVEVAADDSRATVTSGRGRVALDRPGRLVLEALRRMGLGPISLRNALLSAVPSGNVPGPADLATVRRALERISSAVVHSLAMHDGQSPLVSVVPVLRHPIFVPGPLPTGALLRLSRFATLRPDGGTLLLEVPGAAYQVLFERPGSRAAVAALAAPRTVPALAGLSGLPVDATADLAAFLRAAGTLLIAGPDGRFAEDTDPALRVWAHHELLFHEHGRVAASRPWPAGGPPATPARLVRRLLPLRTGPGDASGLTAARLGELLFRATRDGRPAAPPLAEAPAAHRGLELYVTLARCTGLPDGLHHYDMCTHSLTLLGDAPAEPAAGNGLITVTARMDQLGARARGSAYRAALLRSGLLQQTLADVGRDVALAVLPVAVSGRGGLAMPDPRWPAEVVVGASRMRPDE